MEFFITSDNLKLYYEIKGMGQVILFIHGFGETGNVFRIQQRALSKRYKIITYDLRGHGLSTADYGLNMERLALDLKELIDYLKLENIILVGWSMGASIIFEYISLFGEENLSKLCIIDKGPKVLNDYNWNLGLYHGNYTMKDGLMDLNLIKDNWVGFSEKFIKTISPYLGEKELSIGINKMKDNKPYIMYSLWKSMMEKDYRHILNKITISTLIIFGEKSTLYSIDTGVYLKENIRNSQLIVFENCTHLLVLENPIKFNRVLEDFINNRIHNP